MKRLVDPLTPSRRGKGYLFLGSDQHRFADEEEEKEEQEEQEDEIRVERDLGKPGNETEDGSTQDNKGDKQ